MFWTTTTLMKTRSACFQTSPYGQFRRQKKRWLGYTPAVRASPMSGLCFQNSLLRNVKLLC
ncbi:hypothetical protein JG687_00018184 [Phytophthora cactorum]|uniref:Uncharacterized protein n=1 Tax=Phytophthora cactorum TaxID=29920 RepID=A0A8T1TL63_9STRA|nr:hypothetical protein JG687_00018184 [Phytophthora cactorum]